MLEKPSNIEITCCYPHTSSHATYSPQTVCDCKLRNCLENSGKSFDSSNAEDDKAFEGRKT